VTYILKKIRWNLQRNSLEQKILNYCRIEFRPCDVEAAFTEAMLRQEALFMGASK
jgi:hypothetical protein